MFAIKPRTLYLFHIFVSAAVLLQALAPGGARLASAAQASRSVAEETVSAAADPLNSQGLVGHTVPFKSGRIALQDIGTPTAEPTLTAPPEVTPTPVASETPSPAPTSNPQTESTELSVEFSADPQQAKAGDEVHFTLKVTNNGKIGITGLQFSNSLPDGFTYVPNEKDGFTFDADTRELSWSPAQEPAALITGQSLTLTYAVLVETQRTDAQIVDTATLSANELTEALALEAELTLAGPGSSLTMLDADGGEASGLNGQVRLNLPKDSLDSAAAVSIRDLIQEFPSNGDPWVVFELGLHVPQPQEADPLSAPATGENDQAIPLQTVEAVFSKPVELSVSLDGLADGDHGRGPGSLPGHTGRSLRYVGPHPPGQYRPGSQSRHSRADPFLHLGDWDRAIFSG
jgi:uncharacterized repeat protein (TIGR01451 family)